MLDTLRSVANAHDEDLEVDSVRAYHFGVNYFVEIDIVVSGDMTVAASHDLAVDLQHKVEHQTRVYYDSSPWIIRAFSRLLLLVIIFSAHISLLSLQFNVIVLQVRDVHHSLCSLILVARIIAYLILNGVHFRLKFSTKWRGLLSTWTTLSEMQWNTKSTGGLLKCQGCSCSNYGLQLATQCREHAFMINGHTQTTTFASIDNWLSLVVCMILVQVEINGYQWRYFITSDLFFVFS